LTATLVWNAQT